MIGRSAEKVLNRAVRYAVEHDHEYFTLEHVLWSLLAEEKISATLEACGGNPDRLRLELEVYLQKQIPKALPGDETGESEASESTPGAEHPVATLSIQRLIQRALFHVQSSGKEEIQPEDLLVALFQGKNSKALALLLDQGIERLDVIHFMSHGHSSALMKRQLRSEQGGAEGSEPADAQDGQDNDASHRKYDRRKILDDPLALYAVNLNQLAAAGKIDPVIGRKLEMERIIQILCRRNKNNPLLVGEAGVGKTALAEALACKIVEKSVPQLLENAVVYSLDMGALLAGAKFRGDFEQRFKKIISRLESQQEQGLYPILFIDEIHTIIGAGAVSGGALDVANLLKPLLSRRMIRCMGSTTYTEFRSVFEKDHALVRRFQKIDVQEPSLDEAVQILQGLKGKFEEHHGVQYTNEAIQASVHLSARHLSDRFLPDKAIDVIDEAGAKARLKRVSPGITVLDQHAIEDVVAQMARIPSASINSGQKVRLQNLKADLKLSIYGQDPAVDALVTAIRLARSGLRSGDKPVGSFLFCGPTGVGKTELSKQLAYCLGIPFLRFDMSEYSERHMVSRLIGAPPGYVGFEQAGLLTSEVAKSPHSVILLDEIEKAHREIWNILLQVMDHGVLTDNNGKKADFRNTILMMTSNLGSSEMSRRSLGMGADVGDLGQAQKAVEQTFSPEFRNRLDAIVYFNPLDPATVEQVVSKQLIELESQLLAKNVEVEFSSGVRRWLAEKGYDRWMGARPLARLIQDQIKKPLSEEILFGRLEGGGQVHVSLLEGKLVFEFASVAKVEYEKSFEGSKFL